MVTRIQVTVVLDGQLMAAPEIKVPIYSNEILVPSGMDLGLRDAWHLACRINATVEKRKKGGKVKRGQVYEK